MIVLRPDWLDTEEQQAHARARARTAIPTKQRDFAEVWKEQPAQPKAKAKRA